MKIIRIICIILACCVMLCNIYPVYATPQTQEMGGTGAAGCNTLDAEVPYLGTARLVENVGAAFLYETKSDTLMYAWNPDMQIYPSSMVKIITAYYAVLHGNPEDVVTVTETALASVPYDAVSADLQAGEKMLLEDLIYCMMVGSANDAASVIAEHIGGSEEEFVEQLNIFLEDMGCTATTLKNPHGLHNPEQVSTVRDLARVVAAASKNEEFTKYFSAIERIVPATNMSQTRNLSSSNLIMDSSNNNYDERVTGGRTGIADDGSRCLATAAKSDELELICIVTGAQSTFAENGNTEVFGGFKETTELYNLVFGNYKSVQVLYEGQTICQRTVINGECDVVLGSETAVSAILPGGVTQSDLSFRYNDYYESLEAPLESGRQLSGLEIWYGNMCIAEAELVAMNPVRSYVETTEQLVIEERKSNALAIILISVLSAVSVVVLAFVLIRMYKRWVKRKKVNANKHHKHERRNR